MPDIHFDWYADRYDRTFRFGGPERLLRLLQMQPGERLLDVGGGTGRVAQTMVVPPASLDIWVCDPSLGMIAQAGGKGLHAVRGVGEGLPFAGDSFDGVLLVDALHHIPDLERTAPELLRVLRPGRRLVIEEPDIRLPFVKGMAFLERLLLMRSRFLALADIIALVERHGGRLVEAEEGRESSPAAARPARDVNVRGAFVRALDANASRHATN